MSTLEQGHRKRYGRFGFGRTTIHLLLMEKKNIWLGPTTWQRKKATLFVYGNVLDYWSETMNLEGRNKGTATVILIQDMAQQNILLYRFFLHA